MRKRGLKILHLQHSNEVYAHKLYSVQDSAHIQNKIKLKKQKEASTRGLGLHPQHRSSETLDSIRSRTAKREGAQTSADQTAEGAAPAASASR